MDVCDGPVFGAVLGHHGHDQGTFAGSFFFLPTWWLCKTGLRVDDFTSLTCGKAIGAVGMESWKSSAQAKTARRVVD